VLGIGAALLVYGLVRRSETLPLQTLAALAYGGVAVIALFVHPIVGGYLVAAGLIGHAAWDVYHHRTNKVVVRSMSEFCMVFDVAVTAAIIFVTVTV
jgi:hypothetical protein